MTNSTTLMTFLVRCPPTTRSVSLLGSWDNFSKAYAMQRDARVGMEHWRGCHSFKNIICDGNIGSTGTTREGGLKQGGTYWYYYQLDDEIEFHNSGEPSTTTCPLLPGQLVNVLHVPFNFSSTGGRNRNGSASSTSSDVRTMDPAMKYLNPRPAPPPKLSRLRTSPPLLQTSNAFDSAPSSLSPLTPLSASSNHSTSQPSSSTSLRKIRLPKNRSDDRSRPTSPTKAAGFLATLRQLASRAAETPIDDVRGRQDSEGPRVAVRTHSPRDRTTSGRVGKVSAIPLSTSRDRSPNTGMRLPYEQLPIPRMMVGEREGIKDLTEGVAMHSFQHHRRARSGSREPSPLRNSLSLPDNQPQSQAGYETHSFRPAPLDTLKEASSQQSSPVWPLTAKHIDGASDNLPMEASQNKRLPTLPNSPSSAYSDGAHGWSSAKSSSMEQLDSHFSAMTVTTTSNSTLSSHNSSRFPASPRSAASSEDWASNAVRRSPTLSEVPTAFPSFPSSPYPVCSMPHTPTIEETTPLHALAVLPTDFSSSTISSYQSEPIRSPPLAPPGLGIVARRDHTFSPQYFPSRPHVFQYKLPEDEQDTFTNNNTKPLSPIDHTHGSTGLNIRRHDSVSGPTATTFSHSSTMQQLMDELSYLGEMIDT